MYKLAILMILVAGACFGQVPSPSTPMIQFPDGSYLGPDNPMPIDAVIDVGSITLDVTPSYVDGAGAASSATLINGNVPARLVAEAIGLMAQINTIESHNLIMQTAMVATNYMLQGVLTAPISTTVTKYTLTGGAEQTISDAFAAITDVSRKYIEIKTLDPAQVFWVNFGSTPAVVGACRPCIGRVYIESRLEDVSVISSTTIDIFVTQSALSTTHTP